MNNKKTTKRAFLSSAMALIMCMTMLIGTTFAWFTDSVTSKNNIIKSGKLDMTVEYSLDGKTWAALEEADDLFQKSLWEPGHTEIVALKIENIGNLAFKYNVSMNIISEIAGKNVAGEEFELSDYLTVSTYTMDGGPIGDALIGGLFASEEGYGYTNVAPFKSASLIANDMPVLVGETGSYVVIKVDMPETVGNEANYREVQPAIEFGINVLATQYTEEKDSFGNQYDKDATYPVISSASNFSEALQNSGQYEVVSDITTDSFAIEEGKEVALELNGNKVSGATIINNGEISVSDGTIEAGRAGIENSGKATFTNVDMNAGSATDYSNILNAGSETSYENVNINSNGGGIGALDGAEGVFNSGSIAITATTTNPRYNFYIVGAGTTFTINGGTFSFTKTTLKRAYIYAGEGTTVYVNGGNFGVASTRDGYTAGILGTGTVIIKGGTFGFDPSAWVADGYEAVPTDGVWTVSAVQ